MDADDDIHTRPPRVRFTISELAPGVWLRRYLPAPGGWEGETTQIYAILSIENGAVLLKEPLTGRYLLRSRSHLVHSAWWELL